MGELKERFLSVYNNAVHRDGSDMLLRWLEDSDFFVAPASTKFHGCHEGGLLQHYHPEDRRCTVKCFVCCIGNIGDNRRGDMLQLSLQTEKGLRP